MQYGRVYSWAKGATEVKQCVQWMQKLRSAWYKSANDSECTVISKRALACMRDKGKNDICNASSRNACSQPVVHKQGVFSDWNTTLRIAYQNFLKTKPVLHPCKDCECKCLA